MIIIKENRIERVSDYILTHRWALVSTLTITFVATIVAAWNILN